MSEGVSAVLDCNRYVDEVLAVQPQRPYYELARQPAVATASPATHRAGIAALLDRKLAPLRGLMIPEYLLARHAQEHERLRNDLTTQPDEYYRVGNDSMVKDLGIASGHLLGLIWMTVERSGVPRSWMLRGGLARLPGNLAAVVRAGGFTGFLEVHLHDRGARLTESTWFNSLVGCAAIMRANPGIRGHMANAWLFDPAIETVAPHLSYLRKFPLAGAARFVNMGSSEQIIALALKASKQRRALYEQGKFHPRSFSYIWPRARLLRWADTAASPE